MSGTPEGSIVSIAHLSDCHLPNVAGFSPRYWNLKRGLGFLNWHLKRKAIHSRAAVAALVADVHAQAPDHIAVTGDLVNIGLPAEYVAARDWLTALGPPDRVSVVPGNHDIYVEPEGTAGVALWADYMSPDAYGHSIMGKAGALEAGPRFPFLRRVGSAAIVGVNSSCATAVGYAGGEVGAAQRQRLGVILSQLKAEGLFRLVLIHHPPMPGLTPPRRSILDAAEVEAVIARHGAELVLHGHNHRRSQARIGDTRIEGIGSASAVRGYHDEPAAQYALYRIAVTGGRASVTVTLRGFPTAPAGRASESADLLVQELGTSEFKCAL